MSVAVRIRKGRNYQQIGRKRGQQNISMRKCVAPGAQLQHCCDEIDASHQRADAGDFQRPDVVVDADAGPE